MLEKEFKYFLEHKEELEEKYNGRFIVIKDEKVIGSYSTQSEAYFETKKLHEVGTFLIQKASSSPDSYTQTFHSRVRFA